jgi:hypothetical protein
MPPLISHSEQQCAIDAAKASNSGEREQRAERPVEESDAPGRGNSGENTEPDEKLAPGGGNCNANQGAAPPIRS